MTKLTIQELKHYLAEEYLTIEQLSEKTDIKPERILAFIETQCIPPHTYELIEAATITCTFNDPYITSPVSVKYYHPSLVSWILDAETLTQNKSLSEAAESVRNTFFQQYKNEFNNQATPGCQNAANAWYHLMNGTWGICLREVSVVCMAKKELSRLKISKLVNYDDPSHQLNRESKQILADAIKTYEASAKRFAPHIASISSYLCEVEPAKKKYLAQNKRDVELELESINMGNVS